MYFPLFTHKLKNFSHIILFFLSFSTGNDIKIKSLLFKWEIFELITSYTDTYGVISFLFNSDRYGLWVEWEELKEG